MDVPILARGDWRSYANVMSDDLMVIVILCARSVLDAKRKPKLVTYGLLNICIIPTLHGLDLSTLNEIFVHQA